MGGSAFRPPAPAVCEQTGELRPDVALWGRYHKAGLAWRSVLEDRAGLAFGALIYRAIGYSLAWPVRTVKREIRAFGNRWAAVLAMGFSEAELLGLCEKGIGKAESLATQRTAAAHAGQGEVEQTHKWSGVWMKVWKQRVQAAIEGRAEAARGEQTGQAGEGDNDAGKET